jgi:hypothetical protein
VDIVDHRDAALVLWVRRVEQCHDRPRVENERHALRGAAASPCWRVLVAGDQAGRRSVAANDPEPGFSFASQSAGFALYRLTQDLCKRDSPSAGLALEHGQVVALGCHGRASNGHALDASITSVRAAPAPRHARGPGMVRSRRSRVSRWSLPPPGVRRSPRRWRGCAAARRARGSAPRACGALRAGTRGRRRAGPRRRPSAAQRPSRD